MTRRSVRQDREFTVSSTPIGWIGVVAGESGLVEILIHPDPNVVEERLAAAHPGARRQEEMTAQRQLQQYFRGERLSFSLLLDFGAMPPFTRRILSLLSEIPLGTTVTYGNLAARCGRPGAARAVGRAMAANPFPIVVPCHRVVGAGGRLTGYSGGEGIATKNWLLDFERRQASGRLLPGGTEKKKHP